MIARIVISLLIVASTLTVIAWSITIRGLTPKSSAVKLEAVKAAGPEALGNKIDAPQISARSAVVLDGNSGEVLFEKSAGFRHLPASLTKLLTALVALQNCNPSDFTTVKFVEVTPNSMGLAVGDTVNIESLLYGLLVPSGNDAAFALAGACSPTLDAFVLDMNHTAQNLGMTNSHFTNPAGFDDEKGYSTALDIAKLARAAVADPVLSKIVATKTIVLNDETGTKTYYLTNVNKLIGEVDGLSGIKTGQTEGALENLVTKTKRGNNYIIVAVLGSYDRFGESKELIEWTFKNFRW